MTKLLRTFLLLLTLFAYGGQVVAAEGHEHGGHDQSHVCAVCVFGALPGEPTTSTAETLPPDVHGHAEAVDGAHVAPPPALAPLDVSFATSPPTVA